MAMETDDDCNLGYDLLSKFSPGKIDQFDSGSKSGFPKFFLIIFI